VEVGGNIQAMVDQYHSSIFSAAWQRHDTYPDHMADEAIVVKIAYYRSNAGANSARQFNNLAMASYELTVTAGDVASFTAEFMGVSSATPALQKCAVPTSPGCRKLVTWDRCSFTLTGKNIAVQSFTFSVNNNLTRLYKVKSSADAGDPASTLFPVELLAGFRDVTGTVTVFAGDGGYPSGNTDGSADGAPELQFPPNTGTGEPSTPGFGADNYLSYSAGGMSQNVHMTVGGSLIDINFGGTFRRPEASARTDVQVYTLNYQGLCYEPLL